MKTATKQDCEAAWAEIDRLLAMLPGGLGLPAREMAAELRKACEEHEAALVEACDASMAYVPCSEVRNWPPGWALKRDAIEKLSAVLPSAAKGGRRHG